MCLVLLWLWGKRFHENDQEPSYIMHCLSKYCNRNQAVTQLFHTSIPIHHHCEIPMKTPQLGVKMCFRASLPRYMVGWVIAQDKGKRDRRFVARLGGGTVNQRAKAGPQSKPSFMSLRKRKWLRCPWFNRWAALHHLPSSVHNPLDFWFITVPEGN